MAQGLLGYTGVYNGPGALNGMTGEFGGSLGGGMQEFLPQGSHSVLLPSGEGKTYLANGQEVSIAIPLGDWSRYYDTPDTGGGAGLATAANPFPGAANNFGLATPGTGMTAPAGTQSPSGLGGVQPAPPTDAPAALSPTQLMAALVAQLGGAARGPRFGNASPDANSSYAATLQKILAQLTAAQ